VVALAGLPAGRAAGLLDELRAAHLVEPAGADRVVMHDLLRAYARERAVELIGAADRRAALAALYERYLSRSASAMDAAFPATRNRRPDVGAAGGAPAFTDAAQALRWLDAERHTLVDLAATEVDERAPLLARVIGGYLGVGFHTADQFTVHRHALTTARRRGDPAGEARALLELGKAHGRSGDLAAALRYGREAAEVFGRIGDDAGLAEACTHTGANEAWLGRPEVALRDYRMALLLSRRCGDRAGEAAACASIGQLHRAAGRHRAALGLLRRAVRIYAEAGDRTGEGRARNDLGTQLRLLGRYLEALDCHERARQLLHAVGDRAAEACALSDLGRIYSRWGRHGDAISHHERALATFREIDDRIGEAEALDALADAHELAGRPGPAGELRARAAARYAELRMPRADASPAAAGPADDLPARLTTPSG
jgi:tetratricopeptide (TPR) repeat protein